MNTFFSEPIYYTENCVNCICITDLIRDKDSEVGSYVTALFIAPKTQLTSFIHMNPSFMYANKTRNFTMLLNMFKNIQKKDS